MPYIDRHKTPRNWSRTTAYTRSVGARLPLELYSRLEAYCDENGCSMTDTVCRALTLFFDYALGDEEGGREA